MFFFVSHNLLRISSIQHSISPHLRVLRMWILQIHPILYAYPQLQEAHLHALFFQVQQTLKCIVLVGWNGTILDANLEQSTISPEVWISPLKLFSQSPWILHPIFSQRFSLVDYFGVEKKLFLTPCKIRHSKTADNFKCVYSMCLVTWHTLTD